MMNQEEHRKVLNALFGYKTFKKYKATATLKTPSLAFANASDGQIQLISASEIEKAIIVAEKTVAYFELQDDSKGKFVRMYFFERIGWIAIMNEINVAYGTIHYWRKEVIAMAEKIAVKTGFI
jgi:uncharacterized protein YhaN